ncbi:MAG TPA: ATP-binding protein, partial [Oligoflexia bacterium]|nr:ATP-binding protein [Oligoflexia bacterium]
EIEQGLSHNQREHHQSVLLSLRALGANLAIPFFDEDRVLGFVVAQVEMANQEDDWSLLSVVYGYFAAAARILKNMDVYVRIREKERLAALGQMSAGLAHEIRNPLGAIKGAAQVLEGEKTVQESPFLKVIVEEVNRLNKVVTQFLDYSKPVQSDYTVVDIDSVLQKTAALFQSLRHEGIRIEVHTSGVPGSARVRCSPEQIKQVLVNLIQNSIQSLERSRPAEGGVVRVGVNCDTKAIEPHVNVFVEDNGQGIAREDLDKIFIPFFTKKQKGTGLGLSICSKIAEAHGGRLDVVSDENKNTRFTLRLRAITRENSVKQPLPSLENPI